MEEFAENQEEQEFSANPEYLRRIKQLPCPTCGSQLNYSASKNMINCDHCGYQKSHDESNDLIREQSLEKAMSAQVSYSPSQISKKVIDCGSCGAQLMIDDDKVSVRCNFCGSEKVNETAFDKNLIQPQGILPFQIDKQNATNKFQDWIKKGWFHPNQLKQLAQLGDVHGIYVPFWTYDAHTGNNWRGDAGYYYYETETYTSNGETKTRQVRKTRWVHRSGYFERFFDDVLVVASKNMPTEIIEKIFPFEVEKVINYNNDLVVGWESEIYNIDVKDGYGIADQKMDTEIKQQASRELGGDTQRFLRVNSQKWGQTFKHIVLPLWICSYRYNDKIYQFVVNGQTGKIAGKKPLSWIKITFAILVVAAIIGLIVLYTMNNGQTPE